MTFSKYREHTGPLFLRLKLLNIYKIYMLKTTIFMFKYWKDDLPPCLQPLFIINFNVHNYRTRNRYKLHIPLARTTIYQNSLIYKGATAWNYITDIISINCSLQTFKYNLKKYLLDNDIPGIY